MTTSSEARRIDDRGVHPLVLQAIEQGLPATIDDHAVLARIAVLMSARPPLEVKRAA